ncbi:hypothetical protein ACFRKB_19075 [Streptomyces scopuliridis]|uniref:hypothetical protein n=1 Tax=Streptomyces scopuliridis TaxID=452529 RepID=UPI0036801351
MAAAVVLLAAAMLLHFATPHHASTGTVTAKAPALAPETRKHGPAATTDQAEASSGQHEVSADVVARPPRALQPATQPAVVDDSPDEPTGTARAVSGATQALTARESCNPGAGISPTPSRLQTFRC